MSDAYEQITAHSKAEWRSWLETNHDKATGIWLAVNGRPDRIDCGPGRDRATVDADDTTTRCEILVST